ncbi:MAG: Flp family type IVb pilin [Alphaproteobacteria bacterium]|nr:Flp family type IVb pilin [Alphaproteobacteria bacterium]
MRMIKKIQSFYKQEQGATAIEYGLIVAAIGAALAVTIFLLGDDLLATFNALIAVFES